MADKWYDNENAVAAWGITGVAVIALFVGSCAAWQDNADKQRKHELEILRLKDVSAQGARHDK